MQHMFRLVHADSDDLKRAIYQLRYKVYVEECRFESPEDHPDGLEMDAYDRHSVHFAALDEDDDVVGTIRMILYAGQKFPIEHAATTHFVGSKPSPECIAEVSRLALAPSHRRYAEDKRYNVELNLRNGVHASNGRLLDQQANKRRSLLVLSLIGVVYDMSKHLGVSHLYMIAEKKLWRMLAKYGFLFHQIGPPVEYHGLRTPYLGIIPEMEDHVLRTNLDLMLHPAFSVGLEEGHLTAAQ